jgi:hypothetical protein
MSAVQTVAHATAPDASSSPEAAIQIPADETAFKTFREFTDPKQRREANEECLRDFPKSKWSQMARERSEQ